jgi:hypothetical protein
MFRRTCAILIGALAIAAIVAGCGGDDETTELSKAEYVKKANAACKKIGLESSGELTAYLSKNAKDGSLSQAQQEELLGNVVIPSVEKQIDMLEELGIPESGEAPVGALIDELERVVQTAEEDPLKVAGESAPFGKAETVADEYELEFCGHQ